jgi:hypothetical protein
VGRGFRDACLRSDPATVFSLALVFLLDSSLLAIEEAFFPVAMVPLPVWVRTPLTLRVRRFEVDRRIFDRRTYEIRVHIKHETLWSPPLPLVLVALRGEER